MGLQIKAPPQPSKAKSLRGLEIPSLLVDFPKGQSAAFAAAEAFPCSVREKSGVVMQNLYANFPLDSLLGSRPGASSGRRAADIPGNEARKH